LFFILLLEMKPDGKSSIGRGEIEEQRLASDEEMAQTKGHTERATRKQVRGDTKEGKWPDTAEAEPEAEPRATVAG
jgi:hypothetical protein